jgi:hypothetical protein
MPDVQPHLTRDELLVWRDEGQGDRDRIVTHLASCAACRGVAAEIARVHPAEGAIPATFRPADFIAHGERLGPRPSATRIWRLIPVPLAALLLLGVVLLPRWLDRQSVGDSALRGGDARITLVRPIDVTIPAQDLIFEWQANAELDGGRVNVVDLTAPDAPLIRRDVRGVRYEPSAEERRRLPAGRELRWFVEYQDSRGVTVTSAAGRFTLR